MILRVQARFGSWLLSEAFIVNGRRKCFGKKYCYSKPKGWCGKSTTAINLSACLAEAGNKVLTIDLDPQGNTTSGLGVEKNEVENTVYELLLEECELNDCMIKLEVENLSLIPSNVNLAGAEIELIGVENKEFILKNSIDKNKRTV